jgi:hypothetical protein
VIIARAARAGESVPDSALKRLVNSSVAMRREQNFPSFPALKRRAKLTRRYATPEADGKPSRVEAASEQSHYTKYRFGERLCFTAGLSYSFCRLLFS